MPSSGNYNQELEACVRKYVVPEDRDLLLEKASMGNVLDALEREGELMISYGEKKHGRPVCPQIAALCIL